MPRKRQTNADRLRWTCSKCGALGGFPCTDYKGEPKEHCVERGRPAITEKKLQKKADELNAKKVKAAGGGNSLLTYLYGSDDALLEAVGDQKVTAADVASEKLAAVRRGVENGGDAEFALLRALNWITMRHLRRVAAELIGAELELVIWDGASRTYGDSLTYIVARYQDCLCTTKPLVLGYERRFDPARAKTIVHPPNEFRAHPIETKLDGWYAVPTGTWPPEGYVAVMTREEFNARFRLHHLWVSPLAEASDDPAGLFERAVGALSAKGAE